MDQQELINKIKPLLLAMDVEVMRENVKSLAAEKKAYRISGEEENFRAVEADWRILKNLGNAALAAQKFVKMQGV